MGNGTNLDIDLTMDDKLIETEGTESGSVGVYINSRKFFTSQIVPLTNQFYELLKKLRIFNLQVHWKVLQSYFSACGRYNICGVLCGLSVFCAALILWSLWLSDWADDSLLPDPQDNLIHRILGFAGFTVIISK